MSTLHDLYKNLEQHKELSVGDNSNKFLDIAEQIVLQKDPSSIPILLKYFSDDGEFGDYSWVCESLMIDLEHYDSTIHVKALLENLPTLISNAPLWANDMFSRILNGETYKQIFIDNMHLAPKAALSTLFDIMEKESQHHQELIKELRDRLANHG
ncbi:MAG: Imm30 family immunity protein [Alphaproteobacteria bacterium]